MACFSSCTGKNVSLALAASSRHPKFSPRRHCLTMRNVHRAAHSTRAYQRLGSAFSAFARVIAQPRSVSTAVIPYALHLGVTFYAFSIVGTVIFAIAIIMAFAVGRIDLGSTSYGTDLPPPEENSNMQLPERFIYVKHHPIPASQPTLFHPTRRVFQIHQSRRMANREVDDLRSDWATDSNVTFRNHREMEKALDAAQEGNVRFHTTRVSIDFAVRRTVDRDDLGSRRCASYQLVSLSGVIQSRRTFFPPTKDIYPACYVPAHIWLDKGLVSTKVKMHPILLCGCWIESATQNGSGNGGAALLGFVVMPAALRELDAKTLTGVKHTEYDAQKRTIYHAVCQVIMASLEPRSHNGEALRFGDAVTRTAHPGFLIESIDFEEMAAWLPICNSRSNHPCAKCLVHHSDPHKLFECSDRRSPQEMLRILREAAKLNPTQREDLLKGYGLHNFIVLTVSSMNRFPRWRGLKTHLLTHHNRLFGGADICGHLEGAYTHTTHLLNLRSTALEPVRLAMSRTAAAAELMPRSRSVRKGLELLKHHSLSHAIEDIMSKGTSRNMNTRVGEGFQQEVEKMYHKPNRKSAERQASSRLISLLMLTLWLRRLACRTSVRKRWRVFDDWRRSQKAVELDEGEQTIIPASNATTSGHWRLGSPIRGVSPQRVEAERADDPAFRNFNMCLREYIARHHPAQQVRLEEHIEASFRGALLCPIFGGKDGMHYIVDCIDEDIMYPSTISIIFSSSCLVCYSAACKLDSERHRSLLCRSESQGLRPWDSPRTFERLGTHLAPSNGLRLLPSHSAEPSKVLEVVPRIEQICSLQHGPAESLT
ncbi:hypothetical protein C8F01DRAFT_1281311 [Mycena amicta]|nr:hypothetical protein C8F01DRAFT_1281311 [Mycena amicta]